MTKTKRTVEDANVAAASDDSKLITRGSLNRFANGFWTKIKNKYNETFKDAELTDNKKLIFKRVSGENPLEINLKDYARLSDKGEFKQDVSADNVAILSNSHIGNSFRFDSQNRSLGFRQLTTSAFADGYVDHIRVYLEDNVTGNATFKVWAIKKDANGREGDRVSKVINLVESLKVNSIGEGLAAKKFVIIPIKQTFADETYFIVKCSTHVVKVVKTIKPEYLGDVVNLNDRQPPDDSDSGINWEANAGGSDTNTAVMQLFGRESIGTLSQKLNKVNSDSGLYVKQDEVSTTSEANKVVRLDEQGKLDKKMIPSIAINDYFEIEQFTHDKLNEIKEQFENGDVVVVTGVNADKGKRFLCVNKKENPSDLTKGFVELNSKDGIVKSVNGKIGEVNLKLEATTNELKLKITGGGGTADVIETSVNIITNEEIDSIIEGLPN